MTLIPFSVLVMLLNGRLTCTMSLLMPVFSFVNAWVVAPESIDIE